MQLSDDQKTAIHKLIAWYNQTDVQQFITLGGYAGTGKTTLIAVFRKLLANKDKGLKIAFCSYTGRAAQNLKNKLKETGVLSYKDKISTIHGLIYDPIESNEGEIVGWSKKEEMELDLIIVDEASMVDENIWQDLLSYGVPIIAVGDHGQLPPINGDFNLMAKPQILLTHIHRQAQDNPIIQVSLHARETGVIPVQKYAPKVIKYSTQDSESQYASNELLTNYSKNMLILCGYNSTRKKLNQFIRNSLGFETPYPQSGDRVICLRNNQKKGIYNGMLGTINNMTKHDSEWYETEIQMDENEKPYTGLIYLPQFDADSAMNFSKDRKLTLKGDLFDFGYALTVHKAQGSQAKKVVMFEERFKQVDESMWKRWLYTGVTRAEEELYLFGE